MVQLYQQAFPQTRDELSLLDLHDYISFVSLHLQVATTLGQTNPPAEHIYTDIGKTAFG